MDAEQQFYFWFYALTIGVVVVGLLLGLGGKR